MYFLHPLFPAKTAQIYAPGIPFKLAPAQDTVKKTAAQMDISGLNLLLVEDNELNAEIAETLLSDEGANMTVARDGLQAVRMFQEKPEGYFDAILMDIMMPVMDGIIATKTIRSLKHLDAETIPIIAMTIPEVGEIAIHQMYRKYVEEIGDSR